MLDTLRNAWRIDDLRKKIIYTLLMLLVYRVGSFIPVPGVDSSYIRDWYRGRHCWAAGYYIGWCFWKFYHICHGYYSVY